MYYRSLVYCTIGIICTCTTGINQMCTFKIDYMCTIGINYVVSHDASDTISAAMHRKINNVLK